MDKQRKIDIFRDIVMINTVNGNETEVADYLDKLFKEAGIETRRVTYAPGRDQLIASLKGEGPGPVLAMAGHMDVVPVGDMEWEHDPFAGDIVDNKLYGRGAFDMKCGLVSAALAMIELKNSGAKFNGELRFIATVGEETSAIGAGQLVELGEGDDIDALIIGEPSSLIDQKFVILAHKGALWPRITTYGKTAHGSAPELGVNAVEHMNKLVNNLLPKLNFTDAVDDVVGSSTVAMNKFEGGKATNVIPDRCVVEFDIRTIASQSHDDIKKIIQDEIDKLTKEIPNFKAEVEYINDLYAVKTEKDDPFVKTIIDSTASVFDKPALPYFMTGYTDASQFVKAKKKFPIAIFGPSGDGAHQPNEWADIPSYLEFIDAYQEVAKAYLK